MLVDGRAITIGDQTVRFFPSYREIARSMRCHPSTVMRWAQRERIIDARRQRLAADRVVATPAMTPTTETLAEEVLGLVAARWGSRRRAPALRQVATVLRLIACVAGAVEGRPRILRELERLRASMLQPGGA